MLVNQTFDKQRCFTGNRLARKGCFNEKIWIFPVGQRVEKANSVAEKQHQIFDKIFNHDEKREPVKQLKKKNH